MTYADGPVGLFMLWAGSPTWVDVLFFSGLIMHVCMTHLVKGNRITIFRAALCPRCDDRQNIGKFRR